MDQEKIGSFIKKIRKDNNLSQQAFAERLGVSFQAVSKWENGKNLPDISTLKEIKKQFNVNIDEIIDGEKTIYKKRFNKKNIILLIILLIAILGLIIFILFRFKNINSKFEFNEINTTNNDFKVSGSVVKTNDRTSVIINDVIYIGDDDDIKYETLECDLYEQKADNKVKVSSCDIGNDITLTKYLENLKIKVDHQMKNYTMFNNSNMFIEINASNGNKVITYKIPIEINDESCD